MLTFNEIFNNEGLYTCSSFAKGVAIRIRKSDLGTCPEMEIVQYLENKTFPVILDIKMNKNLLYNQYKKVLIVKQLFKTFDEI